jgi:hypothetical protein
MKHLDYYSETVIRHRHEATQRHVERQNVVRAVLAHPYRARRLRFYEPALMLVGRRLVIWGMRLQHLYPEQIPASQAEVALAAQPK